MTSEKSYKEELARYMKMNDEQRTVLKEKEIMLQNVLNKRQKLLDEIDALNMALLICQKDYESILAYNTELIAEIEHLQNPPNNSNKRKKRGGRRKRKKTHKKTKKKQKKSRRK